jgi:hypothetical protein
MFTHSHILGSSLACDVNSDPEPRNDDDAEQLMMLAVCDLRR